MSGELRNAARALAPIFAVVVAVAVVAGVAAGVWRDESVVRWIAYCLYLAGALMIAYPFLANPPPKPGKRGLAAQTDPGLQALKGEIPVLVAGGVALLVVATAISVA